MTRAVPVSVLRKMTTCKLMINISGGDREGCEGMDTCESHVPARVQL